VVKLDGPDALVLTLDFFTPLVDDAFTWGQIAAANAVSDVYAMGGTPLVALNIVGWPREKLPLALLGEVLKGGLDIAQRAGFGVVGGHTVDDPEPKYGMVVIGRADPDRLMTIGAAKPGQQLVLTKPIGTGIITTAIKADAAPSPSVEAAVASMTELNDAAAKALVEAGVRACTDVTGFGLLGHLGRMLAASGVGAEIEAAAVPLLPGARELVTAGHVPGGTRRNLEAAQPVVEWNGADEPTRFLLCDAQTSGGLMAACDDVVVGTRIGRVVEGPPGRIVVRGRMA
jgi:selenide, water dikinase